MGQGESVGQPCYAKTTVALIKTRTTFQPLLHELLPHPLALDPGQCCCCIFGHTSMSSERVGCHQQQGPFSLDRISICGSLVPPCVHGQERSCWRRYEDSPTPKIIQCHNTTLEQAEPRSFILHFLIMILLGGDALRK